MRRSKSLEYKQLNETVRKWKKKKLKVTKLKRYQTCSEPHQSVKICNHSTHVDESMDKQKAAPLVIDAGAKPGIFEGRGGFWKLGTNF